jgi:hypothetical protein
MDISYMYYLDGGGGGDVRRIWFPPSDDGSLQWQGGQGCHGRWTHR